MSALRVLDLFSGIGGFSLGLEAAGLVTVAFCEVSTVCRHLLAHHWPEVQQYDDVQTLTAERLASDGIAVDVVCGGFPCQDLSYAGAGAGLAGARSGLFWEIVRLVRELIGAGRRPRYLVLENVAALLGRGLGEVLGALASLGYDLWWDCIPAFAVGAPHRRDRVWIVAYPRGEQHQGFGDAFRRAVATELSRAAAEQGVPAWNGGEADAFDTDADGFGPHRAEIHLVGNTELRDEQERLARSLGQDVADAARVQRGRSKQWTKRQRVGSGSKPLTLADTVSDGRKQVVAAISSRAESQEPTGSAADRRISRGRSGWLAEPDVGRVAHGVPARVDRLHGLGNAVVPQVPEVLGRALVTAEAEMLRAAA